MILGGHRVTNCDWHFGIVDITPGAHPETEVRVL